MYSDVVMGMNSSLLEVTLEDLKDEKKYKLDTDLTVDDLRAFTKKFKQQVLEETGTKFPNRSERAVLGRDLGGLQILDDSTSDRLPRASRDS